MSDDERPGGLHLKAQWEKTEKAPVFHANTIRANCVEGVVYLDLGVYPPGEIVEEINKLKPGEKKSCKLPVRTAARVVFGLNAFQRLLCEGTALMNKVNQ